MEMPPSNEAFKVAVTAESSGVKLNVKDLITKFVDDR